MPPEVQLRLIREIPPLHRAEIHTPGTLPEFQFELHSDDWFNTWNDQSFVDVKVLREDSELFLFWGFSRLRCAVWLCVSHPAEPCPAGEKHPRSVSGRSDQRDNRVRGGCCTGSCFFLPVHYIQQLLWVIKQTTNQLTVYPYRPPVRLVTGIWFTASIYDLFNNRNSRPIRDQDGIKKYLCWWGFL